MNDKSLLIGIPTYDGKKYCQEEFFECLFNLEIPDGYDVDILVMENNSNVMDTHYMAELNDFFRAKGYDNISVGHVGVADKYNLQQRLAIVYNFIRGYFNYFEFDRMLALESDMMIGKHHLVKLNEEMEKLLEEGINVGKIDAISEYPKKEISPTDQEELERDGIFVAGREFTNIEYNTMIYKKLSLDETNLAHAEEPLPLLIGPKGGYLNVKVPAMNKYGYLIEHVPYSHEEMIDFALSKAILEVEGAPLGCSLIRKEVIQKIPFRYSALLGVFNDVVFNIDLRRAGYRIFVDCSIWPEHKALPWSDMKIKPPQKPTP